MDFWSAGAQKRLADKTADKNSKARIAAARSSLGLRSKNWRSNSLEEVVIAPRLKHMERSGNRSRRGLVTYYVLFLVHLETRRVSLSALTRHATEE